MTIRCPVLWFNRHARVYTSSNTMSLHVILCFWLHVYPTKTTETEKHVKLRTWRYVQYGTINWQLADIEASSYVIHCILYNHTVTLLKWTYYSEGDSFLVYYVKTLPHEIYIIHLSSFTNHIYPFVISTEQTEREYMSLALIGQEKKGVSVPTNVQSVNDINKQRIHVTSVKQTLQITLFSS